MTSKQVTSPPWNSRRGAQAKKWFGHCAGRSPCAHSIGKFFLCYIVLFLLETSAPGLSGRYWYYNIYIYILYYIILYYIILYYIHLYSDYVLRVCMVAQAGWLDQMSQRGVGSQWEWSVGPAICHLNALDRFCIESVLQFYMSSV